MRPRLERYTADTLLAPAAQVSVTRQQVRRVDVHWHDFYELVHVTGGRAVHRLNGAPGELRSGSTFLLTPADFHEISTESDEPLSYFNVVVDPGLIEGRLDDPLLSGLERTAWTLSDAADLGPDFRRLWDESALDRPGALGMMEAVLRCILIELARRCTPGAAQCRTGPVPREQPDVRKAVLFVDRHFREPLSLAGVAAQVHLSPNYFSECFREFTGTSFQTYLQLRRLALRPVPAGVHRARCHRGLPCGRLQQPVALRPRLPESLRSVPDRLPGQGQPNRTVREHPGSRLSAALFTAPGDGYDANHANCLTVSRLYPTLSGRKSCKSFGLYCASQPRTVRAREGALRMITSVVATRWRALTISAVAVTLLATACGSGGGSNEAAGKGSGPVADPKEPVTITFSSWIGNEPSIKKMAADVPQGAPEHHRWSSRTLPAEESSQKLTAQIAGGNPPDAAFVDASTVAGFASRKALANLDNYISRSDVVEAGRLRRRVQDVHDVREPHVRAALRR